MESKVNEGYTKLTNLEPLRPMKFGRDIKGNRYKWDYDQSKWIPQFKGRAANFYKKTIKQTKIVLDKRGICAFDVECKDGLKGTQLFCWALAYKGSWGVMKVLQGGEDLTLLFEHFRKRVNFKLKPKIIYVHNLSYDIRFIIDYCIQNNIEYKPIISGSNFISCAIDSLNIKFIDTVQFLQCSQEKAEKEWEIETEITKGITDSVKIFEKDFSQWSEKEKANVKLHNQNDVKALLSIMKKFRYTLAEIAGIDMTNVVSLASLSMKALRTTLSPKQKIWNPFLLIKKTKGGKLTYFIDKVKERFVRESYYGGRNELFQLGKSLDLLYIDRVSMYPAEMAGKYYPSGIPKWFGKSPKEKQILKKIIKGEDKRLGFIEAKIMKGTATTDYPVIPKRIDGRIMFTDCTIQGVYTSVELQYAVKKGYKVQPIRGLIYPVKEKYFDKFVDKFFTIKQQEKGGRKKSSKIILNSAYGKFGQAFERKSLEMKVFLDEEAMMEYIRNQDNPEKLVIRWNEDYRLYLVMNPKLSVSKKRFMNVGIASFITAYARLSLIKSIHYCEDNGIKVYYGDTDSFTISEQDYKNVKKAKMFNRDLGGWDIEQKFDEVEFIAPKCYISIIDGKLHLKMKGVNRLKIAEICQEVEERYLCDSSIDRLKEVKQLIAQPIEEAERYMTFKESIRNGMVLATKKLTKHYTLENFKRKFNEHTGVSVAWNDGNIPEKYKEDLIDEWEEKVKEMKDIPNNQKEIFY